MQFSSYVLWPWSSSKRKATSYQGKRGKDNLYLDFAVSHKNIIPLHGVISSGEILA